MLAAFTNTFRIPELRARILFTLAMIVVIRVGVAIPLPGVNPEILQLWIKSRSEASGAGGGAGAAVASLLNVFSGGGLENCAIFALGIMPYISASIMMQLLSAVVPRMSKLAREEGGRQKINQYTRWGTIFLCIIQGSMLAGSLQNPQQNIFMQGLQETINKHGELVPNPGFGFMFICVLCITSGSLLLMWLGEQITERGIGNGTSLIICINIVSSIPGALVQVWQSYIGGSNAKPINALYLVMLFALLIFVIAGVIAITQGQRRIAIQYAKRQVGKKIIGGQSQYLPLKVNYSRVMPIIFAQAIISFPSMIISYLFKDSAKANQFVSWLNVSWFHYAFQAVLIFFFSYFWVATMFQPQQLAEDLKKSGGYIPGVGPGKKTADFLDFTMSRLTFAGAIFLTIIAVLPSLLSNILHVSPRAASIFGGTSLLILVGVVLDVMTQVETHLLQRNYEGFIRKGKAQSRYDKVVNTGQTASERTLLVIWISIAVVVIFGVCYGLYNNWLR